MEQRNITGQYRLDTNTDRFFGATTVHFRQIEDEVLGRFGRRGTLKGSMDAHVLRAKWKNDESTGWLMLTFDDRFGGFRGEYGTSETAAAGTISAKRDVRKRSA
jgi:hypothetical protein